MARMDYDERIRYWSGRAAVARRAGCAGEAAVCGRIADILRGLRREASRAEAQIGRLMDGMPVELTEIEE